MHLSAATYYQINLLPEEAKQLKAGLDSLSAYIQTTWGEGDPAPEEIEQVSVALGPVLQLLNSIPAS